MSARDPILILQMQRMGDLVLTFPLMLWLSRLDPGRPLWVVAEPQFYHALMPLSPHVMYVPWEETHKLRGRRYHHIINLSHRPRAAELAGELEARSRTGPVKTVDGLYVHGQWQLYRSSLVNNNRHNRFHWAELNALDTTPLADVAATRWDPPRDPAAQAAAHGPRVGLFLGASDHIKRPHSNMWAALVNDCVERGLRPVLLGGPAEKGLGRMVEEKAQHKVLNLCGELKLEDFAGFGETLALMVTADTGPMHVAAWSGLMTLVLSMGPVSPHETAPYQPGHLVLQSAMGCAGCWRCHLPTPVCRSAFAARRVALACRRLIQGDRPQALKARFPGQRLFITDRDADGLFRLAQVDGKTPPAGREALAAFWRAFFGRRFGLWGMARQEAAWTELTAHPALASRFRRELIRLTREMTDSLRRNQAPDKAFWLGVPPLMRPLSGFLLPLLQNGDFSPAAYAQALAMLEECAPPGQIPPTP